MSSTGKLPNRVIAPGYARGWQMMKCNQALLWVPSDAQHGCMLVLALLSCPVLSLPAVLVGELPSGLRGKPEFEEMLSGFCFPLLRGNRRRGVSCTASVDITAFTLTSRHYHLLLLYAFLLVLLWVFAKYHYLNYVLKIC